MFNAYILVAVITSLLWCWGIYGFYKMSYKFDKDELFKPSNKDIFFAGPIVWILGIIMIIYNFLFVR